MAFCSKDKRYVDEPIQFDPLGVGKDGKQHPTGGPEERARVFGEMTGAAQKAGRAADLFGRQAEDLTNDPGFGAIQDEALKTVRGEYLNGNPQLDASIAGLRRRGQAEVLNTNADQEGQFQRAGIGFSTANQQAAQASQAAQTARSNEMEATMRAQDRASERSFQQAAGGQYTTAKLAPLQYLAQAAQTFLDPAVKQAQVVQGLTGGGQVATPNSTIVKQPGVMDYAISTLGALGKGGW